MEDSHGVPESFTDHKLPTVCWLLVGGPHRSGTTLLVDVLNTHPAIGLFSEFNIEKLLELTDGYFEHQRFMERSRGFGWLGRTTFPEGSGRTVDAEPERNANDIASAPSALRIQQFQDNRDEKLIKQRGGKLLNPWPVRELHFEELALSPFNAVFADKTLKVVGTKLPMYEETVDVDHLRAVLGQFKILHIVRNPIDTIASSMTRRNLTELGIDNWHIKNVEEAALEWATGWRQMILRQQREGDHMMVLKYEDLASNFRATMNGVATFLDVENNFENLFVQVPSELKRISLDGPAKQYVDEMFGRLDALWEANDLSSLIDLFPIVPPPYRFGDTIAFSTAGNGVKYVQDGFAFPEDWGIWTDGPQASLAFCVIPDAKPKFLSLTFRIFVHKSGPTAGFAVKINDEMCGYIEPTGVAWGEAVDFRVLLPQTALNSPILRVDLLVQNYRLPNYDISDPRQLGVGLVELSFFPSELPAASAPRMDALEKAKVRRNGFGSLPATTSNE